MIGSARSVTPLVVVAAAVLLVLGALPASASEHESKPVVLVHQYRWDSGANCHGTWDELRDTLNAWGWGGDGTAIPDVGFYKYDEGCAHWINHHGDHGTHHGGDAEHVSNDSGTCANCQHNVDTDIRHLAYHLAWYIQDHFDASGQCIEAVGYSMGGLVIRYMLAQVERGHDDFPSICVQDVVTYATPHAGTDSPIVEACPSDQCHQMDSDDCDPTDGGLSSFLEWLKDYGIDPDGRGGTQWTVVGSEEDNWVNQWCAVRNIARYHAVYYGDSMGIEHHEYMHDLSAQYDANARHTKGTHDWEWHEDFPHAVKLADRALGESDW